MSLLLWIILLSLIFSAFFSGIEIAFYQANHLRIEVNKSRGDISSRLVSYFIHRPSTYITNCLTGNNIALVVYGIAFNMAFAALLTQTGSSLLKYPFLSFLVVTVTSSFIILFLAEFFPKVIFIINPNSILSFLAIPFLISYIILYPFNLIISQISRLLLLTRGIKVAKTKPSFDYYDLFNSVIEGDLDTTPDTGVDVDTQILRNAIELPNIKVREFMIPRTEIKSIEITDSIENLRKMFVETGHSKIVVYDDNIDQILGYVHIIDLYDNPDSIRSMVKQILIFSEAMPANKLLKELKESKTSLGLVVDEFGGTAGIVTIEDVLEEIFGEIRDEFDKDDLKEVIVNDSEFIFSARLEIDYLNEKYELEIPEGDYETLGGYILEIHQSIPAKNTLIETERFKFKILTSSENRIDEIVLKIKPNMI
jgi:putative hemolysin